jgi:hypothetical protein
MSGSLATAWLRNGGVVAATLLLASPASAFAIRGSVIGSGGSSTLPAHATRQVVGTAGQPAVGIGGAGGTGVCSGFWGAGSRVAGFGPTGSDRPRMFAFTLVSSNPTRGPAQFDLALPRGSRMTLRAFDVSGRQIGDALEQRFEAGRHRLTWGTDLRRSGVYFIRLTSEAGFEARRKIVLVR